MTEHENPEIEPDEDVEGHAVTAHGERPGPGARVGGRFRPDEDEMFGEDVEGHVKDRSLPDLEPTARPADQNRREE